MITFLKSVLEYCPQKELFGYILFRKGQSTVKIVKLSIKVGELWS